MDVKEEVVITMTILSLKVLSTEVYTLASSNNLPPSLQPPRRSLTMLYIQDHGIDQIFGGNPGNDHDHHPQIGSVRWCLAAVVAAE